ncbi:acetylxylan esterase [bacterium]|nr:acetylxylan esterase [bacterium]
MRLTALGLTLVFILAMCSLIPAGRSVASEGEAHAISAASMRDTRVSEEFGLRTPRTFAQFRSRKEWMRRAAAVRDNILVSTGLWPAPEKTPLNPRIFGRIEREGYSVEKVCFESYPRFFVTGNLYRPLGKKGPFPGVLCPHGHWGRGRLHSDGAGSVPGRCINLARQGYVVFSYDMVGYTDSNQLKHSFHDELWGTSLMGLHLWDSIRAVDFISSLPDVNANQIGCTGASGGGTQTFTLMAVDDRIKVAAPVCMISAHFQGGCECENAPLLRLETYNVEIASLMAPRPLILVAATGDWTKNNPTVEYPDIRSIYKLIGAEDKVRCVQFDTGHNYNKDSREAVYAWFGKWLLGIADPAKLKEQAFTVEKDEDLRVFTETHPRPPNALNPDQLKNYLIESATRQIERLKPTDASALKIFRKTMSVGLQHTLSAAVPAKADIVVEEVASAAHEEFTTTKLLVGRKGKHEAIPATLIVPDSGSGKKRAALIVHPQGKNAVMAMGQPLSPLVTRLLKKGRTVMSIDCFQVGELKTGERKKTEKHWLTYNRTDLALRVQDILTAIGYLHSRDDVRGVDLVGLDAAGIWCLLANALAPQVRRAAIDVNGFSDDGSAWAGDYLIPGILRAGGGRVAAGLCVPRGLFLFDTRGKFQTDFALAAYKASGRAKRLRVEAGDVEDDEVARWLLLGRR